MTKKNSKNIQNKIQETGYMASVMATLKQGEYRQFPLADVNVQSWRTVASRINKREGYKKYSVTVNSAMGIMAVKHNVYE